MVVPDGGSPGSAARGDAPTALDRGSRTGLGRTVPHQPGPLEPSLAWPAAAWEEARLRVGRAGRAYVWLNLVEQRLRSVVAEVLRPVYEPAHGDDWVIAAAGPAGEEWVQRAGAVREVSRRKGYLLDPDDDALVVFLTLPQLRELMVQHWPCFEPFLADRRDIEVALDELEVARHVVSRNRTLSENVLAQAERAAARLLLLLDGGQSSRPGGSGGSGLRAPVDAVEELIGDRYADVIGVHPDRVRLQRDLPVEDLLAGARRLDAIGIGLSMLCQNFTGRRLIALADSGCRIRLLFLNPASSALRRRERELGLGRGELGKSVETNIMHVRRVRSRLRDAGAFEIRVYDELPRVSAYLVDGDGPDGLAVVQPYLRRSRGMESPVLVLRGGSGAPLSSARPLEPGLFQVYQDEFEGVWADSRPVS
ncbi:SAV2148 family HEPN domain-containing protein [Streptacidiphilus sp. MAP12-20]|uniref:SAV2148 family HEPN domain-containing protein n=1 Tax=Streptacidiphilus sp. MAP12-20 TaxID=3156299 RepID=UPI003515AFDC